MNKILKLLHLIFKDLLAKVIFLWKEIIVCSLLLVIGISMPEYLLVTILLSVMLYDFLTNHRHKIAKYIKEKWEEIN